MASESPSPPPTERRALRRAGGALLTVLVALAGVVLLLLFFQSRDDSQVDQPSSSSGTAPGRPLAAGELPADVRGGDGARPSDAALRELLERGNVVLVHASPQPPAALRALARRVAGEPSQALSDAGQAVVLVRRPRVGTGTVALAWRRELHAPDAADPRLERFADWWLGSGAGG